MAVFAISSSALLARVADAHPLSIAFWRSIGAAIVLGSVGMARTRSRFSPTLGAATSPPEHAGRWILVAGVALAAHFGTWLVSLEMTSVAASVTLVTTAPLVLALSLTVRGQRPNTATWIAIGLALTGTLVITGGDATGIGVSGNDGPWRALAGDALALFGAAMMAVYLTVGQRMRSTMSTVDYATRTYTVASLVLLMAIIPLGITVWGYTLTTWLALAGMVIGPQIAGHTVLNLLLKELGPVTVSMVLPLEPIGAVLLVWLFLGELPPITAALGAPLVIVGLVIHLRGQARQPQVLLESVG